MCPEETITARHITAFLGPIGNTSPIEHTALAPYQAGDFREARRLFEREYLQHKLTENDGNISRTAEQVGLERSHLHKKLKSLAIIS
jgi:two-component system nitrogen regulation response regulator NtrX